MRLLILFAALGAMSALAIDVPRVGYTRDAQGMVRAVDGLAGNFLVGDPVADDAALAFGWNGTFGIRKTDTTLEWWDSAGRFDVVDVPAGDVVIGFDRANGQSAWLYPKSTQMVSEVSLNGGRLQLKALAGTDEEVLALAGGRDGVDVAVRRPEGIFIVTFDRTSGSRLGEVALTRAASRVLFLSDGSIAGIDDATLWLRRSDGSEWSADTGIALVDLSLMARDWIQAGAFALRTGVEPRLYQIPEVAQ